MSPRGKQFTAELQSGVGGGWGGGCTVAVTRVNKRSVF